MTIYNHLLLRVDGNSSWISFFVSTVLVDDNHDDHSLRVMAHGDLLLPSGKVGTMVLEATVVFQVLSSLSKILLRLQDVSFLF